jgi:hypothetical protein
MSLFDVIKYPISTPVTLEELYAIPEQITVDLLNTILKIVFNTDRPKRCFSNHTDLCEGLHSWFTIHEGNEWEAADAMIPEFYILLRKAIKDYDEPI